MAIGIEYPHVEKLEDQPARLARLPRIRIVMNYLAHGWSTEEMCRPHEYLTLSEVHAALLHYWDHRDEIDSEIREELQSLESWKNQTVPIRCRRRL